MATSNTNFLRFRIAKVFSLLGFFFAFTLIFLFAAVSKTHAAGYGWYDTPQDHKPLPENYFACTGPSDMQLRITVRSETGGLLSGNVTVNGFPSSGQTVTYDCQNPESGFTVSASAGGYNTLYTSFGYVDGAFYHRKVVNANVHLVPSGGDRTTDVMGPSEGQVFTVDSSGTATIPISIYTRALPVAGPSRPASQLCCTGFIFRNSDTGQIVNHSTGVLPLGTTSAGSVVLGPGPWGVGFLENDDIPSHPASAWSGGGVFAQSWRNFVVQAAPTPPPPPSGNIIASPNPCTIYSGTSCTTTISWSSNFAQAAVCGPGVSETGLSGSKPITLGPGEYTYTLYNSGSCGANAFSSVKVVVDYPPISPAQPPTIVSPVSADICGFVGTLIRIFAVSGFIIAVIVLLTGGLRWITASGDDKAVGGARAMVTYSGIGLVILISSVAIVGLIEFFFGINLLLCPL